MLLRVGRLRLSSFAAFAVDVFVTSAESTVCTVLYDKVAQGDVLAQGSGDVVAHW